MWYCRYRDLDGRRKHRPTKETTREGALRFMAEVEERVKNGKVGIPQTTVEQQTTITIKELSDRFLAGYADPRIKSVDNYRATMGSTLRSRVLPTLGERVAATVTLAEVEQLRDSQIAAGKKPGTVRGTMGALSKLYNWAKRVGFLDCPNPCMLVEWPRVDASLDFLSRQEIRRLLATTECEALVDAAPYMAQLRWPMVAVAIFTGLRKGELFGLRLADVAFEAGRLDVLRSYRLLPKSGKPRHVPLHPEAARALRWWRERCPELDGLVFPVLAEETKKGGRRFRMGVRRDTLGLAALFQRAECHVPTDGHPWHMLRHTFATHFIMAGGSVVTLQSILGTSSLEMAIWYCHVPPETDEIALLDFYSP